MEIDEIIETLNKDSNTAHIALASLESTNLSEVDKAFIKTYQPEKSLIIYGTLAPGAPNHSVVKHINGIWQQGIVRGKVEPLAGAGLGYHGFRHVRVAEQEEIKAYVLTSDELVANWQYLDEFEGEEYKRILARFELENGQAGVGYIYAINEDTW